MAKFDPKSFDPNKLNGHEMDFKHAPDSDANGALSFKHLPGAAFDKFATLAHKAGGKIPLPGEQSLKIESSQYPKWEAGRRLISFHGDTPEDHRFGIILPRQGQPCHDIHVLQPGQPGYESLLAHYRQGYHDAYDKHPDHPGDEKDADLSPSEAFAHRSTARSLGRNDALNLRSPGTGIGKDMSDDDRVKKLWEHAINPNVTFEDPENWNDHLENISKAIRFPRRNDPISLAHEAAFDHALGKVGVNYPSKSTGAKALVDTYGTTGDKLTYPGKALGTELVDPRRLIDQSEDQHAGYNDNLAPWSYLIDTRVPNPLLHREMEEAIKRAGFGDENLGEGVPFSGDHKEFLDAHEGNIKKILDEYKKWYDTVAPRGVHGPYLGYTNADRGIPKRQMSRKRYAKAKAPVGGWYEQTPFGLALPIQGGKFMPEDSIPPEAKPRKMERPQAEPHTGCLMADVDDHACRLVAWCLRKIPDEWLLEKSKPHVTLLYGIEPGGDFKATVKGLLADFPDHTGAKVEKVHAFEAGKDGVPLVLLLSSRDLTRVNAALRSGLSYEDDYPDYKPHLTLAYVKPEHAEKAILLANLPRAGAIGIDLDRLKFGYGGNDYSLTRGM